MQFTSEVHRPSPIIIFPRWEERGALTLVLHVRLSQDHHNCYDENGCDQPRNDDGTTGRIHHDNQEEKDFGEGMWFGGTMAVTGVKIMNE